MDLNDIVYYLCAYFILLGHNRNTLAFLIEKWCDRRLDILRHEHGLTQTLIIVLKRQKMKM